MLIYCYQVVRGQATLTKMSDGNDVDERPKRIGTFHTDTEAQTACIKHFRMACRMAQAADRELPRILGAGFRTAVELVDLDAS